MQLIEKDRFFYQEKISQDHSLSIARLLLSDFQSNIPMELQEDLYSRVELAHQTYTEGLPAGEQRQTAFLVHPRDSQAGIDQGIYYADADGAFPALNFVKSDDAKYNRELQKLKLSLLNSLPPFEAAATWCQDRAGNPVQGSIVCIPLDIDRMLEFSSATARIKDYARPLIKDAAQFVTTRLGTPYVGLGEQIAAMTQFGQWLEKNLDEEIIPTTGHAGTIYAMVQTLALGAKKLQKDLTAEKVGIIGCGRIGSAFTEYVQSQHMVGDIILYDAAPGVAEKLAKKILEEQMLQNGNKIHVASSYEEVLDRTQFLVSAVSDPMLGELPLNGHFVVDDSQPPWVPPQNNSGIIAWPSYSAPTTSQRNGIRIFDGMKEEEVNGYNYGPVGLLPGTEWGCKVELDTLFTQGCMRKNHINRPATSNDVLEVGKLIDQAGFSVDTLQSWGSEIPENFFQTVQS